MRFTDTLKSASTRNDSCLCVGLDPEPSKFPGGWKGDAGKVFEFCARIVDATKDVVSAYKPQIAYFAGQRAEDQLEELMAYIRRTAPGVPVILDAKRGDIGSTAEQYAREAFVRYQADAVTLSPFMGFDSIEPYMKHDGKGLILLCRTSNPGGSDLQAQELAAGGTLFEHVARLAAGPWNRNGQLDRRWDRNNNNRVDRRYRDGRGDSRNWNRQWRSDRRYDWRSYRDHNRGYYRMPRYYNPYRGRSYTRFSIGFSLGSLFYGQRYWINDPWYYRLPPAYGDYRWIRYYDDALLVDIYSGRVVDVIYDFFW